MEHGHKVYVAVRADFREDGMMLPRSVVWEDRVRYPIDRVLGIRPGFAAKAGGQGDKYTVLIKGRQTCLYFERSASLQGNVIGRWFVESKV